ncbi:MAG: polysaccharide deacetylase family protein [Chloroflexota bacterium]
MNKTVASLSIDLDDKWTYMKTHGDPAWSAYPSYHEIAVPRILEFLQKRNLKITFFLVGQDAALEQNHDIFGDISRAGHEIANHSFSHEPWLHLYSEDEIDADLSQAEEHIERSTGVRPIGFRGPGFSCSENVLRVLARKGYQYDGSTLPNFLNPVARAYFLMTTKMSKEEREQRKGLFGTFRDGLRPNKPYFWQLDTGDLLEIPVTTMPLFKIPIHASYILYLDMYSPALAQAYFRFAMMLCRITGTEPSILLHPLDFLGCEDVQELSFFPAMRVPREKKLAAVGRIFHQMTSSFTVMTMQEHADLAQRGLNSKQVEPLFHT